MSDPLFWPSKTSSRPIGHTAPISLTQDLSPEQPADILLLGCGDPRNILFTLSADVVASSGPRKLDITCCDIEPAVLARNILLFTLLEDKEHLDPIWDAFYHFKIDDQTLAVVTHQSQKLYEKANSIETWRQSPYGSFLKFIDTRTLAELRRHWKHYADFPNLPPARLKQLSLEQLELSESALDKNGTVTSASLAAGMLWAQAAMPLSNLIKRYWETGRIFSGDGDIQAAKHLNPTFVYSALGEGFKVQPDTFPGFHLTPTIAPIFSDIGNSAIPGTEAAIVDSMKQQFGAWADAFHISRAAEAITLRFYSGEALAFCRALDSFASTGKPATGVFVSAWRASLINLDELSASTPPAPTTFDVIDTSNLIDHAGIINPLVAARPLLKETPASQSILYTETRRPAHDKPLQPFLRRICVTIPTLAVLLGIVPRPYVSTFTTLSDTHVISSQEHVKRTHERIAWVDPSGGDHHAKQKRLIPSFDAQDLAETIHGLHDQMFSRDKAHVTLFGGRIKSEQPFHHTRETLALFLRLVKRRIHLKTGNWGEVGTAFLKLVDQNQNHNSKVYTQDVCLQVHLAHVHTIDPLKPNWMTQPCLNPRSDIFKNWSTA
ncbi:hypothetical protein FS749_015800 [Ceratobasidium sp. UAMH 11750]|nr:hypothetical protein FS749_015800 [Ceratobasidium sp. UAMH 11750]